MIETTDIHKSYGELQVLKGINLQINKAEIVSIVGPSGAGKSTLLQIIGTLDKADKGKVKINDTDLARLNKKELARFRNKHIGFIFQFHHLLPEFNALENVCIPAYINNTGKTKSTQKATELLNLMGLKDRLNHKPSELSGGEQQRVAVARALMNDPSVILADEPSGNLDSQRAGELHQLFLDLRDELKQTFVIVTHDRDLADLADRKLEMRDGKLYRESELKKSH